MVLLVEHLRCLRKSISSPFANASYIGEQIALGDLVVDSPRCTLASNALQELDQAMMLYEQGSHLCRPPGTMVSSANLESRVT